MPAQRRPFRMDHPVVITLLILAVVAFMYFAGEVLKPLALAVLLSFALAPLARWLEGRGLPRTPAVVLTVLVALGLLGGVGYVVWGQLNSLAGNLTEYRDNIETKLRPVISPRNESAAVKLKKLADDVTHELEAKRPRREGADADPADADKLKPVEPQKVEVVKRPTFQERLSEAIGPVLEPVALGFFVLILVLFILMGREDLRDRIVRLFGNSQVSLTTRTMDEVGTRISRYIGMFATVNSIFGLIVGLGLWAMGVEYAALWGFLAAALRFIPYAGPATAFALPMIFSIAHYEDWTKPLEVLALFGVMEVAANSFLEPVIYGKTTGVSALGLLVAAMFWTWLWGALGLLLSTPLTVCLAVLGKYVPSLGAFATLLGEDAELEPDVRYYQRLIAGDQDGATELIEEALRKQPRAEVFDTVLVPALSRAERDLARDEIDDTGMEFARRVTADILDNLEDEPDLSLNALASKARGENGEPAGPATPLKLLGVAANDASDALALRMLGILLAPADLTMEVLAADEPPLKLAETIALREPGLVVLSHLPPVGLTSARYLAHRLHARLPQLPILVGRWGEGGDINKLAERLKSGGASKVAFRLVDARDAVLEVAGLKPAEHELAAASP